MILDYLYKIYRYLIKLFKKIFVFLLIVFFVALPSIETILQLINTGKMFELGISVITPLAALISFSSLMYSRARVLNSKLHQFKSLYVAERLMSSAKYYLITILIGFICYQLSKQYHFPSNLEGSIKSNPMSLIFGIPTYFFVGACIEFYFAMHALNFNISGARPEFVAPKIKKLLKNSNSK